MRQIVKEFLVAKLAKLLDHLYFQETQASANQIIIVIFFIQKSTFLLFSRSNEEFKFNDIYFYICTNVLQWVTFQKPLEIINSDSLNLAFSIFYQLLQLMIFCVFCFSLYNRKIVASVFTFYMQNFQLVILYHVEIHILTQSYDLLIKVLLAIPLYINYFIIMYCSRNYFLMAKQNLLKKYSYYNYFLIFCDFVVYLLQEFLDDYSQNLILFALFLSYFLDSILFKPYSQQINDLYIFITFLLVEIASLRILMWSKNFNEQIYIFLLIPPFGSILILQIKGQFQQLLRKNLTIELILELGNIAYKFSNNSIQVKIALIQFQYFIPNKFLDQSSIILLLELYQKQLLQQKGAQLISSKLLLSLQREEVQLFIIFLNQKIYNTYLQSLILAKQFQIENQSHSLFFQVITRLISEKYDQQVRYLSMNQNEKQFDSHKKLIEVREVQLFYTNYISEVSKVLDQKIMFQNKILSGLKTIEELLDLLKQLNKEVQFLQQLNKQIKGDLCNFQDFKNLNILSLRYFSFYYAYILNNYTITQKIEQYLHDVLIINREEQKNSDINKLLLTSDLIIVSASILENKGAIINGNADELSYFFGIDILQIKYYFHINQLMPQFINQSHDVFLDKFVQKGISELNNKSKLVYGQDGEGFLIPIELSLIHINEKSRDFILTAILQKQKSSLEYILFDEKGKILGITKQVYQMITRANKEQTQQVDKTFFECYIQFWIPALFQIIEQNQKSNDKKIVDIQLSVDYKLILEKYKTKLTRLNVDQFILNNLCDFDSKNFSLNSSAVEVIVVENYLPNGFLFYNLQILTVLNSTQKNNLSNNFIQFRTIEQTKNKIQNQTQQQRQIMAVKLQTELELEDSIKSQRQVDSFQKSLLKELKEKNIIEEKLISHQLSYTQVNNDMQELSKSVQLQSKKFMNNQSIASTNQSTIYPIFQSREIIQEILQKKSLYKNIKFIYVLNFVIDLILILISSLILLQYFSHNLTVQRYVQIIRLPDKFNRIYCSFSTLGQIDLERILLETDQGEYFNFRAKELSQSLHLEMEEMMITLKNEFSKLQDQNLTQNLNIRILNQYFYQEDQMSMLQFNLLANFYEESLNNFLQQNYNSHYSNNMSVIQDEYFKLQFLKGNLVSEISSSQALIDQMVQEIQSFKVGFQNTIQVLFITKISITIILYLIQTILWKSPYKLMKLFLQLITIPSNDQIYSNILQAKHGKQIIQKQNWKQINYFEECFNELEVYGQLSTTNKTSNFQSVNQTQNHNTKFQRVQQFQFSFKMVYLKNGFFMLIMVSFSISCYLVLVYIFNSSQPAVNLIWRFVQFKQDWNSLMILSLLLKTNSALTKSALELGFLDHNYYLKNQSLYFHNVYQEMVISFSEKVSLAKSLNDEIFIQIINQDRLQPRDKETILNLYSKNLCIVLEEMLPFCSFKNGKFTYFPNYPISKNYENNKEIFQTGISGIFIKILEIIQTNYQQELLGQNNSNSAQNQIFIQSYEFRFYILEYFFDINKALLAFFTILQSSILNILQSDYNYILNLYIIAGVVTLCIYSAILFYNLNKLQNEIQACQSIFTLLPQDCLSQAKCLSTLKLIQTKYRV